MKNLTKLAVVALGMFAVSNVSLAFNTFEEIALKNMNEYLKSKKYDTRVRNDDHSLNFMVGENIFWLTFDGNADGIVYTLHRRPINLVKEDTKPHAAHLLRENAVYACAEITATKPYKAYLRGDKVQFEYPVYAATVADYQKIFPRVLNTLNEVNAKAFEKDMDEAKKSTEQIRKYWINYDPDHIVVQQKNYQPVQKKSGTGKVALSNPQMQALNMANVITAGYGQSIYQSNLNLLQTKVSATADKAGTYEFAIQIVNPDGKIFIPNKDETYTDIKIMDLSKNKATAVEFTPFGSDMNTIWKPGPYTIRYFVNGTQVLQQQFNIL